MMQFLALIVFSILLPQIDSTVTANDGNPSNSVDEENNVEVYPQDKRSYKSLVLDNGLRVLLISDPTTYISAASMVVGVGTLNDDTETPGIVNLVECLLLRSRFKEFVRENFGDVMHTTYEHRQSFSFEINSKSFLDALERFSRSFIQPILERESFNVLREDLLKEKDEHQNEETIDQSRILLLKKLLSKEGHPFNRISFSMNEDSSSYPSLNDESVMAKLLEFHSKWYSSNLMCLAILGRESIDILEKVARTLFSDVKNTKAEKLTFSYDEHPWGAEQLGKKVYMMPETSLQLLSLVFPAPNVFEEYFIKTAPETYVTTVLNHRGPGTLFSALEIRNLCKDIQARYESTAGIAFFNISVILTGRGVEAVYEVINFVFQYIHLVRNKGVQEWFFKDLKLKERLDFMYNHNNYEWEDDSITQVEYLATLMQDYPTEKIFSFEIFRNHWDEEVIRKFLDYLSPENMNLIICSPKLDREASEIEPLFEIPYVIQEIPAHLIQKWKTEECPPELRFPSREEFRSVNFQPYNPPENASKSPILIQDSVISQFWFKQDFTYKILDTRLQILCPIISLDLFHVALGDIFVEMVKHSLEKEASTTGQSELAWQIDMTNYGFTVVAKGYRHQSLDLLKKIVSKMTKVSTEFTETDFNVIKKECIDQWEEFYKNEYYDKTELYVRFLVMDSGWDVEDHYAAMKLTKYNDMEKFLRRVFSSVFVQGLIHGNCSRQNATATVDMIEELFKSVANDRIVLPQQILLPRAIELEYGSQLTYNFFRENSAKNVNNMTTYQIGAESVRYRVILMLLCSIIEPWYEEILNSRSIDTIKIRLSFSNINPSSYFVIMAESQESCYHVDSMIKELFLAAPNFLNSMSDTEFENYKSIAALSMMRREKMKNLQTLTDDYWREITNRLYNFDRPRMELTEIQSIRKSDVLAFFMKWIDESSPKRRELTVRINRGRGPTTLLKRTRFRATVIPDITAFKSASTLLPHSVPYISVAPLVKAHATLQDKSGSLEAKGVVVSAENAQPFENQVGGHVFIKEKASKGMMKDAHGNILKPLPRAGPAEIYFYENLETTTDATLLELKEFVPTYLGTSAVNFQDEDMVCLRLENLTKDFELPCIMDIKLGVKTWEPTVSSEEIEKKKGRFVAVKEHLGFGIPGFQYHSAKNGNFEKRGKDYCKTMSPEVAIQKIFNFLNGKVGIECGFVNTILERLQKIHSWFRRQRRFHFYSSSVLLVYDAKKLESFSQEIGASACPKMQVYFIDFTHAAPSLGRIDSNCYDSLTKLIYVFENLVDLYKRSLLGNVSLATLSQLRGESKTASSEEA